MPLHLFDQCEKMKLILKVKKKYNLFVLKIQLNPLAQHIWFKMERRTCYVYQYTIIIDPLCHYQLENSLKTKKKFQTMGYYPRYIQKTFIGFCTK